MNNPPRITTVIFDYGCVLSHVPGPADFEPLRKAIGAKPEVFQDLYWRHREAYDLDLLSVSDYFQEMGKAVGVSFTSEQLQQLAALDCQIWAPTNPVMVEWAGVLRDKGFKTAVLSNMSLSVGNHLRREAGWMSLCDLLWFSAEHKIGKPETAFYRSCLERLGVTGAESLFIDDREVNITAANALGIHAILFRTPEELLQQLEPYRLKESLAAIMARPR
jgi:putative hydrolase of the HAD superfamily